MYIKMHLPQYTHVFVGIWFVIAMVRVRAATVVEF